MCDEWASASQLPSVDAMQECLQVHTVHGAFSWTARLTPSALVDAGGVHEFFLYSSVLQHYETLLHLNACFASTCW